MEAKIKQHITIEQVRELSDKQVVSLYNHLYKKSYTVDDLDSRGKAGGSFKDGVRWFNSALEINTTIGRMFEILDGLPDYYEMILHRGECLIIKMRRKYFEDTCICDCLWKAVKEHSI